MKYRRAALTGGLIDHSDSLGATARFGRGDVQWLTAAPNPLELFQIWLNLPAASKMAPPRFAMFWSQDVAHVTFADSQGRETEVAVISGRFGGAQRRRRGNLDDPHGTRRALDAAVELVNGTEAGEFLLLQGRPIGEPVVQYGPFVMNTQAEIAQTFSDYRQTQFGGWPWADSAPTHGRDPARFARHPGGVEERP